MATSKMDPDFLPAPDVFSSMCASREVFQNVTGRWGALVVVGLAEAGDPLRFAELRRRIDGVSDRMLSQTLGQLEREGIVVRTVHSAIPPHVDYTLTGLGKKISEPLAVLAGIIESKLPQILETRTAFDES